MAYIVYRISSKAPSGEFHLKPESWRILPLIDGERSLAEIAQIADLDEMVASRITDSLCKAGVLEIVHSDAPPHSHILDSFFNLLTRELTRAMGSFALVVLEEEIEMLDETRARFPLERVPELVERLSETIDSLERRVQFQQVMLEAIRKLA